MRNLLSANFSRLWRSMSFWVVVGVMFAAAVLELALTYPLRQQGLDGLLDNRYMIFAMVSGVVLSAFCSLFVGTEYSDGTMRNKITAGHSRMAVYLSQLTVCSVAGVLACFGFILPIVVAGIPLLGPFTVSVSSLVWFTACAFVMTATLCAVFTMIAMLNQNKAVVAIICIFLSYFLLFLGIYLNTRLTEKAVIPAREYIENGQVFIREAMPNPSYVQGVKRRIFEILYDLPGCQAVQLLATAEDGCPVRLPLVCLGSTMVTTGIGLALFQRKDLK